MKLKKNEISPETGKPIETNDDYRIYWGFHALFYLIKKEYLSSDTIFVHNDDPNVNEILKEFSKNNTTNNMECVFHTYDELEDGELYIEKKIYFLVKSFKNERKMIKRTSALNEVFLIFDKRFLFFENNLSSEFLYILFSIDFLEKSGFFYESDKFFLNYEVFSKYITKYTLYTDNVIFPSVTMKYKITKKKGLNDKVKEYVKEIKTEKQKKILFLLQPDEVSLKKNNENFFFSDILTYKDSFKKKVYFDYYEKIVILDPELIALNPQILHLICHNTKAVDIVLDDSVKHLENVIKNNQDTFEKYMMISIPSHKRDNLIYSFSHKNEISSLYVKSIEMLNLNSVKVPFDETKYETIRREYIMKQENGDLEKMISDRREVFENLYKTLIMKQSKKDEKEIFEKLISKRVTTKAELGFLVWTYLNNENSLYTESLKKIEKSIDFMLQKKDEISLLKKFEKFNISEVAKDLCLKHFISAFLASIKNTNSFKGLKGSETVFKKIKDLLKSKKDLIEKNREWVKYTLLKMRLMRSIFTELYLGMKDHNREETEKKYGVEKIKKYTELTKEMIKFIDNISYDGTNMGYIESMDKEDGIDKTCMIKKINRNTKIGVLKENSKESIVFQPKNGKKIKIFKKDLEIFEPLNIFHSHFDKKFKDDKNIIKINIDGVTSKKMHSMYGFKLNDYGLSKYNGWVYAINENGGKMKYVGYLISTKFCSKKHFPIFWKNKKHNHDKIEIDLNTSSSEMNQKTETINLINGQIVPSLRGFKWPEGYELLLRMYIDCWKGDFPNTPKGDNQNYNTLKFCLTNLSRINEIETSLVSLLSEFRTLRYIDDALKERIYLGMGYLFKDIFKYIDFTFKVSFEKGVDFSQIFTENNQFMNEKFFNK